jgi:type II restriction/modification system DNA methylase subunit YeeA
LLTTGRKDEGPAPAKPLTGAALKKARHEAEIFALRFLDRLERVRVLDPACGSGNFLYVTLRKLKDLESEVYDFMLEKGLQSPLRVGVGPWQLFGIEINAYAHELAQMTVWIGYLQWLRQHGTTTWKEPVLQAMSNIECKDAILDLTDPDHPKEPDWPPGDFVVGNPPFLGGKLLRRELGDDYVESMFHVWDGRVPKEADLCGYWFEKARNALVEGKAQRAGLLATQGIRGGANRKLLERIKSSGDIFWAWSDREWVLDGAAVRVSMVGFDVGLEKERQLDGIRVSEIHANLSSGAPSASAKRLAENLGVSFMGDTKGGPFDLRLKEAAAMLRDPNPHGRPNSDVLVPWCNGLDLVRRNREMWIVDFGASIPSEKAAGYAAPWKHITEHVFPERSRNRRESYREQWWLHVEPRQGMRAALQGVRRFVGTARVAKHRLFGWFEVPTLADSQLIVTATDSDARFGVLHSRLHEVWALAQGTQLREKESGFRYTPTTCFETFPFPSMNASDEAAISEAAVELDRLRRAWLNPPEWTKEEVLEFPGSVDGPWKRFVHEPDARGIGTVRWPRIVAKDAECATKLAKRTLTSLYNERPAWLDLAHRRLDEAVFAAYGWPADLTDEQILERLLALNLERAAGPT